MSQAIPTAPSSRRLFVGGSDARIIMGDDEAALIRLWREKRGEAAPEDLSGNLMVQLGTATEGLNRLWYERNTGRRIRDVQRRVKHSAIPWMAATLDGVVEGSEAVFEAKFMLPWSFSEEAAAAKAHGAGPAQHVGHPPAVGRALDHHRRRQMGRDHDPGRSALSQRPGLGREEVLALCPVRRAAAPVQCRAAAGAGGGHPHCRHDLLERLGASSRRCSGPRARPSSTTSGPRVNSRR